MPLNEIQASNNVQQIQQKPTVLLCQEHDENELN